MSDSEVLRQARDRWGVGVMPRERSSRTSQRRQPAIFSGREVADFPVATDIYGAYPKGFLSWAARVIGCGEASIVHMCAGTVPRGSGFRFDIRREAAPDAVADARALPLRDGCAAGVLIDPPYTVEYSEELYGVEYPRPSALLREAARILKPGAAVGFLHFLAPQPEAGLRFEACFGITTGLGYRIRAFTVYRKSAQAVLA